MDGVNYPYIKLHKGCEFMNNVYDELKSRDLIKQLPFEDEFIELVKNEKISV